MRVDIVTALNDLKISNELILQEVLTLKAEIEAGDICPSSFAAAAAAANSKSDDGAGANGESTNGSAQMRAPLLVTLALSGVHYIAKCW